MATNKPILGLLTYSFFTIKGGLKLLLAYFVAAIIVAVFFEVPWVNMIITGFIIWAPGYHILMKSEDTTNWEQFQISMPITRRHLNSANFVQMLYAAIFGLLAAAVLLGIDYFLNQSIWEMMLSSGFQPVGFGVGITLMQTAIIFPLALTSWGNNNQSATMILGIVLSTVLMVGISTFFSQFSDASWFPQAMVILVSLILFFVSWGFTGKMYERIDF